MKEIILIIMAIPAIFLIWLAIKFMFDDKNKGSDVDPENFDPPGDIW